MTPIVKIYRSGELVSETIGVLGETLLQRVSAAGVFLDAPCGGKGHCKKCLVRLSPEGEQVLACRTHVEGDTEIYLQDVAEMKIADSSVGSHGLGAVMASNEAGERRVPSRGRLGVAIDIGTTTVVAHLTDIGTGARIATASGVNAQRPYGADVISRIQYCAENGHETLTRLIQEQLSSLIRSTCTISGERARDIGYVSIAANTIMEHLACGLSPVGMGIAPFTPLSLFGEEAPAWEGLSAAKNAKVYFTPAISSYVGGDTTAGLLAAGLEDTGGPAVYPISGLMARLS